MFLGYRLRSWLRPGDLLLVFFIWYGATRFALEFLRAGNWTFFGSDNGGKTAAVLLSFIAMCKRNTVEPFAWFRDVLSRIATHPINQIEELLPHNWKTLAASTQP